MAVSHTVAVNCEQLLSQRLPYQELGASYLETVDRERLTTPPVKREDTLGSEVTVTQKEGGLEIGRSVVCATAALLQLQAGEGRVVCLWGAR